MCSEFRVIFVTISKHAIFFSIYLNNNEADYQALVVSQTYATTFNLVE